MQKMMIIWYGLVNIMLGVPASSSKNISVPLQPFTAEYNITSDNMLLSEGRASYQLERDKSDVWLLTFSIKSKLFSVTQKSYFTYHQEGWVQPVEYQLQRVMLGKNKKMKVTFDWKNKEALSEIGSKKYRIPLVVSQTLDDASVLMQLCLDNMMRKNIDHYVVMGRKKSTITTKIEDKKESVQSFSGKVDAKYFVMKEKKKGKLIKIWISEKWPLVPLAMAYDSDGLAINIQLKSFVKK